MGDARALRIKVFAALAAVTAIAAGIVLIAQRDDAISKIVGPSAPVPSVSAAASLAARPTPSHRATPNSVLPAALPVWAGTRTVTGTIYELGAQGDRHPVSGVSVHVWVFGTAVAGAYPWMTDVTDATGRYELWGLPDYASVVIWAAKQGYLQPCAVSVQITGDYVRDVEIVPTSSGGAAAAAAALRGGGPFLTGIAYEQRPDGGRIPVANVAIAQGKETWAVAATTVTDDLGRYLLCSVPAVPDALDAAAPGYTAMVPFECIADDRCWNVRLVGNMTILDIEMKR